jgi:hypothetical protein
MSSIGDGDENALDFEATLVGQQQRAGTLLVPHKPHIHKAIVIQGIVLQNQNTT